MEETEFLAREPDFLLREELREVESYYATLMAIASGKATIREIATSTGLPERSLHYYLNQLSNLGYVAKHYPLTGAKTAARHVRFVIDDPLLRFWFRFIFPNMSFIQVAGPKASYRERIKAELDSYEGLAFECLCREALPLIYRAEDVTTTFEIGEYWSKKVQIDVVGIRGDNWTDLGECKWGRVRSPRIVEKELEGRIRHFPNLRGASIGRRFFLRARPPRGMPTDASGHWYDLESVTSQKVRAEEGLTVVQSRIGGPHRS